MRWFWHLVRMPPGRLPGEVLKAHPTGRRGQGRARTLWRDCVSQLAWEHLGISPEELDEVAGFPFSGCCPCDLDKRWKKDGC